jgi:hypothetical protein
MMVALEWDCFGIVFGGAKTYVLRYGIFCHIY